MCRSASPASRIPSTIVLGAAMVATFLAAFLAAFLGPGSQAWAHKNGINTTSCIGCHTGGKTPTVTLSADVTSPALGQLVTLTISVSQTNGPTAGFYLTSDFPTPGAFKAIDTGTTATTVGATHSMPRTGSGGFTTFKVGWSSSVATGVQFSVYALSANGDGTSKGDGAGEAHLAMVTGCTGTTYYIDQDDDGFGTSDPRFVSRLECTQPTGYSATVGDCDDLQPSIHPGAAEVCNGVDDNCNGMVDEGTNLQLCGAADAACVRGACPNGPAGGAGSGGSGGNASSGGPVGTGGRAGGFGTGGAPGRDGGITGSGTGGAAAGPIASGGAPAVDPPLPGGGLGSGSGPGTGGVASGRPASPDAGAAPGAGTGGSATEASGQGADSSVAGGCRVVGSGSAGERPVSGAWWRLLAVVGCAAACVRLRRRRRGDGR